MQVICPCPYSWATGRNNRLTYIIHKPAVTNKLKHAETRNSAYNTSIQWLIQGFSLETRAVEPDPGAKNFLDDGAGA